jgi:hypothetical protein
VVDRGALAALSCVQALERVVHGGLPANNLVATKLSCD